MTAPLAQDCFAHGGTRIAVPDALALLEARTAPVVGTEKVPLRAATGRCLARTLRAERDVPAFDNVAVDGYAFAATEASRREGGRFQLLPGRAAAGHPFAGTVPEGAAVRALTGAPMPDGADTVALQEEAVALGEGWVALPAGLKPGANRRRAGEDVRAGQELLAEGHRLRPQDLGLAAELGLAELSVFAPLRVAVLSTGDEIVEPKGEAPAPGAVFDANRHILAGLLRSLPAVVTDLGIVRDDRDAVRRALAEAARAHHAVLTSGGASRGDEDHVVRGVAELGRLDFWRVAMKPGRPLAFGRLGERAVFVGLPGNPVAATVCFLLFARPVLLRLAGAAWRRPTAFPVPAAFAARKQRGRTEYLRATLRRDGPDGRLAAVRIEREGSGILTSIVDADGLVELGPEVERVEPGEPVPFLSFAELGVPT